MSTLLLLFPFLNQITHFLFGLITLVLLIQLYNFVSLATFIIIYSIINYYCYSRYFRHPFF